MENRTQQAEFGWPGGDRPGELDFRTPVAANASEVIIAAVAAVLPEFGEGAELHALTPQEGAVGRFRLATSRSACFVRVSARRGEPALEQALTGWLRNHGLPVNHLEIAGLPLTFGGQSLRLDIRELLDARHDDGSLEDLQKIAASLARCHQLLRDFPRAGEVRALSAERLRHLASVCATLTPERVSDDKNWVMENQIWLAKMMSSFQPRFDLMPGAQCIHAQVHRGNVLFRRSDGAAVLLDFEEAVQTVAPVAWDLAYFVQRFCLADNASPEITSERLGAVRAAYGRSVPGLAEMMRQTAWFSMVILADNYQRGIVSPRSEYDKFVRLEKQARNLAPTLGTFFDA